MSVMVRCAVIMKSTVESPRFHELEAVVSDLGVFLGVVGGIVTSILLTIQKSKCKNIKCCGCECDRDPKLNTNPSETTEP